ncbi:hypothetical protein [Arthrobacter sp. NEB 688]|uniref:hypothetical protein n=1 Tax=Arthrobacter sp. NEB 688 TaxID=904039 RepID=UPI0015678F64|nr:hypothetical protein [Arthrobacter sp. NEB 688]QKE82888.1 hypothetical protein HL663_02260 [Arthrobacter sp. NEB 688]
MTRNDLMPPPLTLHTSHGPAELTLRLKKKPGVHVRVRLQISSPSPRRITHELDIDPTTTTWHGPVRIGPGEKLTPLQRVLLRSELQYALHHDQLRDLLGTPWGLRARACTYEHTFPNGHRPPQISAHELPVTVEDQAALLREVMLLSRASLRYDEDAFLAQMCRTVPDSFLPLALDIFRDTHGPNADAQQATDHALRIIKAIQSDS